MADTAALESRINDLASDWTNSHSIEKKGKKTIHDSVHGAIELEGFIASIVDLPPVQRLREISQLGPVERVYPTANHTRFEHSLGVYQVACEILDGIDDCKYEITEAQKNEVKAAAILHDIGHLPFSHMSERFIDEKTDIDEIMSEEDGFISKSEIDTHEYLAVRFIQHDYFSSALAAINRIYGTRLNADEICKRIIGQETNRGFDFLTNIVHGPLDADRIDYLLRDTQNIGLPNAVDVDRILSTLKPVEDPEEEMTVKMGIDEKGIRAAESLFTARDRLGAAAHNHHVTLISEGEVLRAIVQEFDSSPFKLVGMTDIEIHERLKNIDSFSRYRYRQLPKRYAFYRVQRNNKEALNQLSNVKIDDQIQCERDISDKLGHDALIIKTGFGDSNKSEIGETVVDFGGEKGPEELEIQLNRRYETYSVRESERQIQVFVNWAHLSRGEEIPSSEFEAVKEIIADNFDVDSSSINQSDFCPNSYQALRIDH